MGDEGGNRRIDRVLTADFVDGLGSLPLDELRARRDEALAEREYLSLLRRLVQGRAEILKAELERRGGSGVEGSLVEWSPGVRAHRRDRVQLAVLPGEQDGNVSHGHPGERAVCEVALGGELFTINEAAASLADLHKDPVGDR